MTGRNDEAPARRTIRSFVRRAGRITPSQERALDELWPDYGVDYAESLIDFDKLFKRTAPVVVEIGFGNGESLVELAAANPDQDFLGIEVHEPGVGHCLLKAKDAGIQNLKVVAHDAVDVLTNQVPADSLARVNLYFPDPWPKKRHHKRRIVQSDFVDLIANKLADGGTLNVATDWANYAEHIDEVLSRSDRFTCIETREHAGDQPFERPQTKFERRGLRRGHEISDRCFEKVVNSC
jgi:tRNA (guanine-N7-)-methyltransferase